MLRVVLRLMALAIVMAYGLQEDNAMPESEFSQIQSPQEEYISDDAIVSEGHLLEPDARKANRRRVGAGFGRLWRRRRVISPKGSKEIVEKLSSVPRKKPPLQRYIDKRTKELTELKEETRGDTFPLFNHDKSQLVKP